MVKNKKKGPLSPKYYYSGTISKQAASLKKWTKQDWQTSDGSKSTQGSNPSGKRYMPKAALANMSAAEKAANNKKKKEGTKKGKQFVSNTKAGKRAMRIANNA